ncbi:MAG: hypothetical protein A2504_05515 [Bdellovibrionales bacterium RIFOXYD12_FULL_39_22]|nr:MAG: hypothetical protein A2385_06310 [Bdellovibrionales bacterium RIFOXYB1_FULL_39_21]OFZ41892.1 MAG: hypothetical protein A2485_08280 [Bdellovibrionales bacterium RIFOXYC12_FULL_39_17]OFZ50608.1 MAG: hypothetical protein A2404_05230 [Bdellovibrionales bacterium RIFOXYC1_FULL_39_130]OFZ77831.1 MAG: hypothetical protein A2560_00400 [Bdellovibrionales bacterium RIFOXYD1_FULL_39_84]OFZ93733.1 MAG: hypothetical protein A2504_05515 [Bdellovibrionales bacterium RIFOXYD12_FULL_39_22]HLE11582.1 hy
MSAIKKIFLYFFLLFYVAGAFAAPEDLEPHIYYAEDGDNIVTIINKFFPDDALSTEFHLRDLVEKIKRWNPKVQDWKHLRYGEEIFVGYINTRPFLEIGLYMQAKYINFTAQLTSSKKFDFSYARNAFYLTLLLNTRTPLSFILESSMHMQSTAYAKEISYDFPSTLTYGGGLRWKLATEHSLFFDFLISKERENYLDVNKSLNYSDSAALANLKIVTVDFINLVGRINYRAKEAITSYHLIFKKSGWGNALFSNANYREDSSLFSYSLQPQFHVTRSMFVALEYEAVSLTGTMQNSSVNYSLFFGFAF